MDLKRPLALAALLLCLTETGQAQTSSGCAPTGATAPNLAVHRVQGARVLRLDNGPAMGRGIVLAYRRGVSGGGAARPMLGGCLGEARGRMIAAVPLDVVGAFEMPLSAATLLARPTLSVVTIPPGASLAQASLSNSLSLGPVHDRDPVGLGTTSTEIVITEFMKDPSTVGDSAGEWIELFNPGSVGVDIEGWVLSDLGSDSVTLANAGMGIVVPAGDFLVLGKNDDPTLNGGVTVDFVLSGTTLSNGDDEIILSLPDGRLVDQVVFDGGTLWPDAAGRSASLEISAFDVVANDDPARWCNSSTPLSATNTDTGTPGLANDSCLGG
ncbi:MAG: hypothetical protein ACI8QZ_001091 [Chlamydiales bacterium]|jgi:hypothetical protein